MAAMANGVSAHAMDYDFSFVSGQAVVPVIPAILAVAETAGAPPAECLAAFIVGCEVAACVAKLHLVTKECNSCIVAIESAIARKQCIA